MWRLAPLVMRLTAVSLVAIVVAEPGTESSLTLPVRATAAPARTTVAPRRQERRQRNRRKTTTTTTTFDPEEEEDIDLTTPVTTTTVDPRTFDHSTYFIFDMACFY